MLSVLGVAAAACTSIAKIEGVVDAPSSEVIVKLLDMNRYSVLDTVATDADGRFAYEVEVEKGQPEFVYIFHKDTKVASLLLEAGDKVRIKADTLGLSCEVEGSQESQNLAAVEKDFAAAYNEIVALSVKMQGASADDAAALKKEFGQKYISYYRSRVKYVMENSHSLTVVPVFYQNFGSDLPVFSQNTDAILMKGVADSLATVYPDSKYVKSLRNEAERRFDNLELLKRLENAQVVGFPNIVLPDTKGEKVSLSSVAEGSKLVMLYFWSASDAAQKMFNQDMLKGLYAQYHDKGFDIYQVSLDPDKGTWARVVKDQQLPWTNVCDARGANSPYAFQYNVQTVPAVYMIKDGELVDGQAMDDKSVHNIIQKLLKQSVLS